MKEIQSVPINELYKIIETRKPIGLFLSREKKKGRQKGLFVAVDNLTGNAWTEEFIELEDAEDWLSGKNELEV